MNLAKYHNRYRKEQIRKIIKAEQEKLANMTEEERTAYFEEQKKKYEASAATKNNTDITKPTVDTSVLTPAEREAQQEAAPDIFMPNVGVAPASQVDASFGE